LVKQKAATKSCLLFRRNSTVQSNPEAKPKYLLNSIQDLNN